MNMFKDKLSNKDLLIGIVITLDSMEIVESVSNLGLDWLFIDMEHSPIGFKDVQRLLMVKSKNCPAFVRVPTNNSEYIKQVLDMGADGIIVPVVNTKEAAEKAINAAKYPPEGERSFGISRAHGYGQNLTEYISSSNEDTNIILQIEHKTGIENLEEILSVKGIDGILIGPGDLSASMGHIGNNNHPDVIDAIKLVKDSCKKKEIPVGIFVPNSEAMKSEEDIQFIAVGTDMMMIANSIKEFI